MTTIPEGLVPPLLEPERLVELTVPSNVSLAELHLELSALSTFTGIVTYGERLYASFAKKPTGATRSAAERKAREHRPGL